LRKNKLLAVFIVFLIFAGIIALTQELETFFPGFNSENNESDDLFNLSSAKNPVRWFRSNAGGMALEEIDSKFIALRNEYALSVDSAYYHELPQYLLKYYNDEYYIEVRTLYKNNNQLRAQWLFKDLRDNTRLNAVFLESEKKNEDSGSINNIKGFMEIFDEETNLSSEYRFFEDGGINKIEYVYNDNLLINSTVLLWEDGDIYNKGFTDYYRYNRSLSLRSIERIFYKDMESDDESLRVSFPRFLMDAAKESIFISERLNLYPSFFGNVYIRSSSKMLFEADDRGRISRQTLYNENDEVIWVIRNTWSNNRIISTTKTEGINVFTAEFQYNSNGDRIYERNIKNNVTERIVRTEGKNEIEELFMDNVMVLRAVWEDGIKISETRTRN